MGKKNRSSNKQVYKRNSQRVFLKGEAGAKRWGMITDHIAKVLAFLSYPFYLLISKLNKKDTVERSFNASTFKSKLSQIKLPSLKGFNKDKAQKLMEKYMSFVNAHKIAVSAVAIVMVVALIGVQALSGFETVDVTAADAGAAEAHVISVADASSAEVEALSELPDLGDLSVASIKTYEILVNGNVLGRFKTEAECEEVLDSLVTLYTSDEETEVIDWYFSEIVEVKEGYVPVSTFDDYDDVETMLAYIVKGTKEEKTHIVEKGENYWVIAAYYGIKPSDLEAANPDVKPETLQIGQKISLVVPRPLINVCTVERMQYIDSIPYEVTYEDTDSLYKEETKVKIKGVEGERDVIANVVKQNGRELTRTILEETVLSEPTTKVVYTGTKDPPPRMGTGTLIKPVSRGYVTSEFGARWGSRHEGIDIGLPVGSDVKAADGGVVTFAGYSSSYGYYIKIDHGGNIMTVYGHCSKLLVTTGTKVYQGQLIAYSGNTGRSTGPHLHFEVRKNGTPVNPRNYVTF